MADESFPTQVDNLIKEAGATWEGTSVCTSWLLITEWVDDQGRVWLEEHRTVEMPAWKRLGILSYIMDTAVEPEEDYYDD